MPGKLKIEYFVEADAAALAARAARHFIEAAEAAVAARGVARIAISGGSTPKVAFGMLADPALPWLKRMIVAGSSTARPPPGRSARDDEKH